MKAIILIFFLAMPASAVDVSEVAKALKRECSTCSWRAWVPVLEALERGPKREAPKPIAHYERPPSNPTKTDYELALTEARRLAAKLKRERQRVLGLLLER